MTWTKWSHCLLNHDSLSSVFPYMTCFHS
jgi:hypothetical protein